MNGVHFLQTSRYLLLFTGLDLAQIALDWEMKGRQGRTQDKSKQNQSLTNHRIYLIESEYRRYGIFCMAIR